MDVDIYGISSIYFCHSHKTHAKTRLHIEINFFTEFDKFKRKLKKYKFEYIARPISGLPNSTLTLLLSLCTE